MSKKVLSDLPVHNVTFYLLLYLEKCCHQAWYFFIYSSIWQNLVAIKAKLSHEN